MQVTDLIRYFSIVCVIYAFIVMNTIFPQISGIQKLPATQGVI